MNWRRRVDLDVTRLARRRDAIDTPRARVRCAPFRSFLSSSSRARSLKTRVDVCVGVGVGVSSRRLAIDPRIVALDPRIFRASNRHHAETSVRIDEDVDSRHRRAFASLSRLCVARAESRRRREGATSSREDCFERIKFPGYVERPQSELNLSAISNVLGLDRKRFNCANLQGDDQREAFKKLSRTLIEHINNRIDTL